MKKVILLVILVILIALILWWNSRRHDDSCHLETSSQIDLTGLLPKGSSLSPLTSSFGRRQARNFAATSARPGVAKADLVLSDDDTFLSYSILVKQNVKPIESIDFTVGNTVKKISGPRAVSNDETIVHGLWRRNDAVPFTAELAESIKKGDLKVEVKFAD